MCKYVEDVRHNHNILPNLVGPRGGTILPYIFFESKNVRQKEGGGFSYISAALEDDGFVARTFTISKSANCLGRFVGVSSEEVIKSIEAEFF